MGGEDFVPTFTSTAKAVTHSKPLNVMVGTEDDNVALGAPADGRAAAGAEPFAPPEAPPTLLNVDKVDLMSDI